MHLKNISLAIIRPFINHPHLAAQKFCFRPVSAVSLSTSTQAQFDNEALSKIVKSDKVVVFMKGVPEAPRCGFSNAVVQVLKMHGVPFQSHNVLESEDLRKAIKDFTSWPTIPQIFLNGEFIGGCDILLEKHQNGELIDDLMKIGIKSQILKNNEKQKNEGGNE